MPLYFLGFMGMTRRLSQNIDIEFHFLLSIAAFGAVLIGIGILLQVVQFWVSIRDRNDNLDITGDPWDGRTLEWSTSSPAPLYNFAIIPNIEKKMIFGNRKNKIKNLKKINIMKFICLKIQD